MKAIYLLFAVFAFFALMSCDTVWDEPFTPDSDLPDSEGFYICAKGNFVLRYKLENNNRLLCRYTAVGTGWIGIGFAPQQQMSQANFIIGYYDNTGHLRDDWGISNTGHASDLALCGTNDCVLVTEGSDNGVSTYLQFMIPLDSGDPYDTVLTPGVEIPVIFAAGSTDDFDSYHTSYATGSIKIR